MPEKRMVAIISPKSFSRLDTPFVDYFRRALIANIGEEKAQTVIAYTFREMARMDEENIESPVELDLANYGYPMMAIFRGLIQLGWSEEESWSFVTTTWQRMPESLKARPWNDGSSENKS